MSLSCDLHNLPDVALNSKSSFYCSTCICNKQVDESYCWIEIVEAITYSISGFRRVDKDHALCTEGIFCLTKLLAQRGLVSEGLFVESGSNDVYNPGQWDKRRGSGTVRKTI